MRAVKEETEESRGQTGWDDVVREDATLANINNLEGNCSQETEKT